MEVLKDHEWLVSFVLVLVVGMVFIGLRYYNEIKSRTPGPTPAKSGWKKWIWAVVVLTAIIGGLIFAFKPSASEVAKRAEATTTTHQSEPLATGMVKIGEERRFMIYPDRWVGPIFLAPHGQWSAHTLSGGYKVKLASGHEYTETPQKPLNLSECTYEVSFMATNQIAEECGLVMTK